MGKIEKEKKREVGVALRLVLVLILVACRPSPPTSGLEGQVLIGPMCPVVQAGTPCPDQPYAATIAVHDDQGQEVAEFASDAQGGFKVNLAPGTYTLVPQSPDGFTMAPEQDATVSANSYTIVTINYDSGIR